MDSASSADAAAQRSAAADESDVPSSAGPGGADSAGGAASPDTGSPRHGLLRVLLPTAAAVLAVDQTTKIWAAKALDGGRTIDLFWTLRFRLVHNTGAAFSVGETFTPVIAVAAIAVAVAVVLVGCRTESTPTLLALGLILGGAVGNVIDRLVRDGEGFLSGAVVDFIDVQWWPVFNVADMGIVLGGIGVAMLMSDRSQPHE